MMINNQKLNNIRSRTSKIKQFNSLKLNNIKRNKQNTIPNKTILIIIIIKCILIKIQGKKIYTATRIMILIQVNKTTNSKRLIIQEKSK